MPALSAKKIIAILAHGLVGWGMCAAVIGIGRSLTTMETTLIIHAAAVPVIFGAISFFYFKKCAYTTPLQTALIFFLFAAGLDAGLVAPVFEKSFRMFASVLGTWIPFGLIFISTYLTGWVVTKKRGDRA